MASNTQEAVIGTNNDAAHCKMSAVQLGYYEDPFVQHFAKKFARRPPLINRGYASRVLAIEMIIKTFLQSGTNSDKKQIVSFGAGFDTTYFKLKSTGAAFSGYYEVDYPDVVQNKIHIIKTHKELSGFFSTENAQQGHNALHSNDYHLFSADLNSVLEVETKLVEAGIDVSAPTLFISECVLIYIDADKGTELIRWVSDKFPISAFVTYEQMMNRLTHPCESKGISRLRSSRSIMDSVYMLVNSWLSEYPIIHPHDAFGSMMIKNLDTKGCGLLSIFQYPDLATQKKRYTDVGWQIVNAEDMLSIYNHLIPRREVTRIERLEMFDELEEWVLIQTHYCIVLATKDPSNNNSSNNNNNNFWQSVNKLFEFPKGGSAPLNIGAKNCSEGPV